MKYTNRYNVQFLDGCYEVQVSLERQQAKSYKDCRYFINAVVLNTGLSLTHHSYGILKSWVPANNRRKAKRSIDKEVKELLEDIKESLEQDAKRYFVKDYTVTVKTSSGLSEYIFGVPGNPVPIHCIKSLQSGETLSWHYYDVFKENSEITLHFKRKEDGQPQVFADENELYDFKKLEDLVKGEDFKNQKYSFFFYNEAKRLLDIPFEDEVSAMSGMFGSNIN